MIPKRRRAPGAGRKRLDGEWPALPVSVTLTSEQVRYVARMPGDNFSANLRAIIDFHIEKKGQVECLNT